MTITAVDELARFRLDGRVAVVSGGAGGIGGRLSLALAAVGARVAVLGRSAENATELATRIGELGSEAHLVSVDVTRREEADRAIEETVSRFGRVDIIVNAVGGGAGTALYPAESYPEEEWDRILNLNLRSDLLPLSPVYWNIRNGVKALLRRRDGFNPLVDRVLEQLGRDDL